MWKATHLVVSRIETGIVMLAETIKDEAPRPDAAGAPRANAGRWSQTGRPHRPRGPHAVPLRLSSPN
jgi:hypothetical protein